MPAFSTYVENVRFMRRTMYCSRACTFLAPTTSSSAGSESAKEFFVRDKAYVAWIAGAFVEAEATSAKAVGAVMHADSTNRGLRTRDATASGFLQTLDAIEAGAKRFG